MNTEKWDGWAANPDAPHHNPADIQPVIAQALHTKILELINIGQMTVKGLDDVCNILAQTAVNTLTN